MILDFVQHTSQMTKIEPIDSASTDASLEMTHNYWVWAVEQSKNIQTKDDAKVTVTHSAVPIVKMLISGRFPTLDKLQNREYSSDTGSYSVDYEHSGRMAEERSPANGCKPSKYFVIWS